MSLFSIIRDFLNQGLVIRSKIGPREAKSRSESEALYYGTKRSASINKGYTLIEILLVITIIGILAGVVLVVFGPVKEQAREARISSDLIQLQNIAENIYLEDGDYSNLSCAGSPELQVLCNDIADQGSLVEIRRLSSDTYCAYAYFDPTSLQGFCVDYLGFASEVLYPAQSCGSRSFCNFTTCPDFNDNGVVDCSTDPASPECPAIPDPVCLDSEGDPVPGAGVEGSDLCCVAKCSGLTENTPVGEFPDCGSGGCSICPDDILLGGDGNGFMNECLDMYDVSRDGEIDLFDDIFAVVFSLGKSCE